MEWSHIFETFIGAAFAFAFAWLLQRQLVKRQERFQERMQKEQQDFQARLQKEALNFSQLLDAQKTNAEFIRTLFKKRDADDANESE